MGSPFHQYGRRCFPDAACAVCTSSINTTRGSSGNVHNRTTRITFPPFHKCARRQRGIRTCGRIRSYIGRRRSLADCNSPRINGNAILPRSRSAVQTRTISRND